MNVRGRSKTIRYKHKIILRPFFLNCNHTSLLLYNVPTEVQKFKISKFIKDCEDMDMKPEIL